MTELVYRAFGAPLVGENPGTRSCEMLPVVEQSGLVVGRATRRTCHNGSLLLHPVVHLHIIDRSGRLYIQHRSETKDLFPGRWDTAVGGHVSYGEFYSEALMREAGEELGFREFNPIWMGCYVNASGVENELVGVFAAVGDFELDPDNDEVSEGRYWTEEEIVGSLGKSVFTPNFEEEYIRFKDALKALL